jgi:protein-S-isoprenylcysteine O-methyltransferase Ste14
MKHETQNMKHEIRSMIKKALVEYLAQGFFIGLACFIYFHQPFFVRLLQPQAKLVIWILFLGYVILGLPYFLIRNIFWEKFYRDDEGKSVLAARFFLKTFPKKVGKILSTLPKPQNHLDFGIDDKTRVAVLSIIVKFFYVPIMISFLFNHYFGISRAFHHIPINLFSYPSIFNWWYNLVLDILFSVDVGIFTFGYLFEAKYLNNVIRSVDPYLSGWVVALICYPPFNSAVGSILNYGGAGRNFLALSPSVMAGMKIAILFFYIIYVWATVALWTKSSNLTNRGIVGSGPYKYIRHPAYLGKNMAWWLERLPYMTTVGAVISLLIWNCIYVARALTEERHLLRDPDYQKYCRKVKYRFIPGII